MVCAVEGAGSRGRRTGSERFSRALALATAAALLLGAAGGTAPAAASVTTAPGEIVVSGEEASAVVQLEPFRLSFRDGEGRQVLTEAPGSGESFQLPPYTGGSPSKPTGPALYAPLSFLVGSDEPVTFGTHQANVRETGDVGDLESDEEAGVEYSAQRVVAAAPSGEGVVLTVATNDPSGRTLSVNVGPDGASAIRVHAAPSDPAGGRGDGGLLRLQHGGGLPRLRRPSQRARPARPGILQLGRPGERRPTNADPADPPRRSDPERARRPPTTCSPRSSRAQDYGFELEPQRAVALAAWTPTIPKRGRCRPPPRDRIRRRPGDVEQAAIGKLTAHTRPPAGAADLGARADDRPRGRRTRPRPPPLTKNRSKPTSREHCRAQASRSPHTASRAAASCSQSSSTRRSSGCEALGHQAAALLPPLRRGGADRDRIARRIRDRGRTRLRRDGRGRASPTSSTTTSAPTRR